MRAKTDSCVPSALRSPKAEERARIIGAEAQQKEAPTKSAGFRRTQPGAQQSLLLLGLLLSLHVTARAESECLVGGSQVTGLNAAVCAGVVLSEVYGFAISADGAKLWDDRTYPLDSVPSDMTGGLLPKLHHKSGNGQSTVIIRAAVVVNLYYSRAVDSDGDTNDAVFSRLLSDGWTEYTDAGMNWMGGSNNDQQNPLQVIRKLAVTGATVDFGDNAKKTVLIIKLARCGTGYTLDDSVCKPDAYTCAAGSFELKPWGHWVPETLDASNNLWMDLSGNGQDGVLSGNRISIPSPCASGNGASVALCAAHGDSETKVQWPANSVAETFTVCSITRYTSESAQQRILHATSKNWVHGHHSGLRGVANFGSWKTDLPPSNLDGASTDWLVFCSQNQGPDLIFANAVSGQSISVKTERGGYGSSELNINHAVSFDTTTPPEPSDWALAELIVWDRALGEGDFSAVHAQLVRRLSTSGSGPVYCAPCVPGLTTPLNSLSCLARNCSAGEAGALLPGNCSDCEAGKYKSTWGSHGCSDCTSNSNSAARAATCICNAGYYPDLAGLGSEVYIPPYAQFSASSVWSNDPFSSTGHGSAQLDSGQAWSAGQNAAGQWLQVDMLSAQSVNGIVTQGRNGLTNQFVTGYKVMLGDSEDALEYVQCDGADCVFTSGKSDTHAVKYYASFTPKQARYVRVVVQTWSGHISMRMAVLLSHDLSCVACPAGSYKSIAGGLPCVNCTAGEFSDDGSTKCSPCPAGQYTAGDGTPACSRCDAGLFNSVERSANCSSCSAGKYSNPGATECLQCPVGQYSAAEATPACSLCPAGRFNSFEGSTNCKNCSSGQYSNAGARNCSLCPAGKYSDEGGASACLVCPAGLFSPVEGSANCTNCSSSQYSEEGADSCTDCPENSMSTGPGTVIFDCLCNAGYTNNNATIYLFEDSIISAFTAKEYSGGSLWRPNIGSASINVTADVLFDEKEKAFHSPGPGDLMEIPIHTSPGHLDEVTFEIWLKPVSYAEASFGWAMSQSPDAGWSRAITLADHRLGYTSATVGDVWDSGLGQTNLGVWTHLVAVWEQGGTATVYRNGVKGNSYSPAKNLAPSNNVTETIVLGGRQDDDALHFSNILIHEVVVYNTTLTEGQVAQLYAKGRMTCLACSQGAYKSTVGSHACETCPALATSPPGSANCSCAHGYVVIESSNTCGDANECQSGSHTCGDALPPRNAACYNTDGSFECDCASGWVWAEDSRECVDANECEWAIPRCDCNAVCNNTEGSYECLCQDGWSGKGTPGGCADIDECRQGEPCASRLCNNTSGSFVCVCPRGYEHLTSGQTCEQIDECVLNPCDEVANCTDTDGSFLCQCEQGFKGSGLPGSCFDINECEVGLHDCEDEPCVNTLGSFHCFDGCRS